MSEAQGDKSKITVVELARAKEKLEENFGNGKAQTSADKISAQISATAIATAEHWLERESR